VRSSASAVGVGTPAPASPAAAVPNPLPADDLAVRARPLTELSLAWNAACAHPPGAGLRALRVPGGASVDRSSGRRGLHGRRRVLLRQLRDAFEEDLIRLRVA